MSTEETSTEDRRDRLRILFIHHSCGGQWLAPVGPDVGERCIYETSPNGGNLRSRLEEAGHEVHEASYGSLIGDKTDIFDWPRTFSHHMEKVLTCDHQDQFYDDGRRNDVVMFKPCYPNNLFVANAPRADGSSGPALTVDNAKKAYRSLLVEFAKQPDTLFIAVTAPPLAPPSGLSLKSIVKQLLGRPDVAGSGVHARAFNNWLSDAESGWLRSYDGKNVYVFDYYDVLTGNGASNFSRYPTGLRRDDSHPSAKGNQKATEAFLPLLEETVRRARVDTETSE